MADKEITIDYKEYFCQDKKAKPALNSWDKPT